MSDERLQAAIKELRTKTLRQIQIETAITWMYRCGAAKAIAGEYADQADLPQVMKYTSDAGEYGHEALEHAALAGDDELLRIVRAVVDT